MKTISDIDKFMAIKDPSLENITWYSPLNDKMFKAYGSNAFYEGDYARLSKSEREEIIKISEPVEWLSKHSAGLQLKFKTNSTRILLDVSLRSIHDMCHMPATGQCGFDLYVYDEEIKDYVLHNTATYSLELQDYKCELSLFSYFNKELIEREYIINFPLYQGIKDLKIGLDSDSYSKPVEFKNKGKIMLYGTSIAQGGCVSRPGMMYSNILSRWLDIEVYNQGYSGSAMLEPIMGDIIGRVPEQKLFIIDAEANAGCDLTMEKNLEMFINNYKKHYPYVPILLVSRCLFNLDRFNEDRVKLKNYYKVFVKNLIDKYKKLGYEMYFLDGDHFFDGYKLNYTEFTVDGVHPTDFGNFLIAKHHYEIIKKILN